MTFRPLQVGFAAIVIGCLLIGAGCGGSGGSTPTTLGTGVAQLPNTGVRALDSASYTPSQPVVESISVVPQNGSLVYALEDAPPAGWVVSDINEGGIFDPLTGKVKWGPFFDQCPLYFTFTATPPAGATGTQTFVGTLSIDGVDSPVTGQSDIPHS